MRDDFRSDGEMWNIEHICVENIGMPHTGISKYFAHNNTFKNVLVSGGASLFLSTDKTKIMKQISFYFVLFKNSWFLLNKNRPKWILRQKIYVASNLIFWVEMGWGTGHLAWGTS